jgi:hypothetical protein
MELKNKSHEARKYGLIAIVVIILQGIIIQPLLYFKIKYPLIFFVLFFYWVVPFLVAYLIEKRDRKLLGFILRKKKYYHIFSTL